MWNCPLLYCPSYMNLPTSVGTPKSVPPPKKRNVFKQTRNRKKKSPRLSFRPRYVYDIVLVAPRHDRRHEVQQRERDFDRGLQHPLRRVVCGQPDRAQHPAQEVQEEQVQGQHAAHPLGHRRPAGKLFLLIHPVVSNSFPNIQAIKEVWRKLGGQNNLGDLTVQ